MSAPPFAFRAALIGYAVLYLAYLSFRLEGEFGHWVSLVVIPFVAVVQFLPGGFSFLALRGSLELLGVRKQGAVRAVLLGALVGIPMTGVQLLGRQGHEALRLFLTPSGWLLLLAGLALMCVTAAATEEFFFRGVLIGGLVHSGVRPLLAGAVSSALFVAYHVPYAYFSPHWESQGHFVNAIYAALGNALVLSIAFSGVYVASRRHLLAPFVAHALTNMVPVALYLQGHLAFQPGAALIDCGV